MQISQYGKVTLFLAVIILWVSPYVYARGSGTVTQVSDDEVTITLEQGEAQRDDLVRLVHVTGGGLEIEAGTWIVTRVSGKTVTAAPQIKKVTPRKGMTAFFSPGKTADRHRPEQREDIQAASPARPGQDDIEISAAKGDVNAQYRLGWMYQHGRGVEKDLARAVFWYQKAAGQNFPLAQNDLGWMYQNGLGVAKDLTQAVFWYRKASENGFPPAQDNLGWMYQNGLGVPKDYGQAFYWYRTSAEKGRANAQNNVGYLYFHGYGVNKDLATAMAWYQKAADQGHHMAQYNLGFIYYYGDGVPADKAKGLSLLRKSAESGFQVAIDELSKIGER